MSKKYGVRKPSAAEKAALEAHHGSLHGHARNAVEAAYKAADARGKDRYRKALDALDHEESTVTSRALDRV